MKTILLVEDEQALNKAIKLKLEQQGYKVLASVKAEEALEFLKKEKPDFIWLDLLLPGMNGFEFLKELKKHEEWKNIPAIMVSVSGSADTIEEAYALGVKDYIVKSQFNLNRIVDRVKLLLSA